MDGLSFKPGRGAHGISLPVSVGGAPSGARAYLAQVSARGRGSTGLPSSSGASVQSFLSSSSERKSDASPPPSFWLPDEKEDDVVALEDSVSIDRGGRKKEEEEEEEDEEKEDEEEGVEGGEEEEPFERKRRGNWVLRILQIASLWAEKARRTSGDEEKKDDAAAASSLGDCCCDEQGSDVCCVKDGEEAAVEFDKESFSRMLRRVPLAEAREYAKMSYLGNLAYGIPKIKVFE